MENEENNFKEKCDLLKKNMDVYESSVISTMKSGIPNVCSRVRRLCKYSLDKSKYFKTDSLCMIVSQSINLTGFALCGLFHEHEQPIQTYKVNLKLYEVSDALFDLDQLEAVRFEKVIWAADPAWEEDPL